MKALISLVLSTMMLNLSVHAKPTAKKKPIPENKQEKDQAHQIGWEKQKMEGAEASEMNEDNYGAFEKDPRPYSPDDTSEESVKTH